MKTLRTQLNEYLFHEFGHDGPEDRISDSWPFQLREVGRTEGLVAFEFEDEGERFFAIDKGALTFLPVAGMTFEDLILQTEGSRWIGARDPVDLATGRPGDPVVPSSIERRNALQALGESTLREAPVEILEGLFLRTEKQYLGLFARPGGDEAVVAGFDSVHIEVAFRKASPWRRLAWGIGAWLRRRNEGRDSHVRG
jgi:hypothetical protein